MKIKLFVITSFLALSSYARAEVKPDECTKMLSAHVNGLERGLKMAGGASGEREAQAKKELAYIDANKGIISDCDIQSKLPGYIQKQKALKAGLEAVEKLKAGQK